MIPLLLHYFRVPRKFGEEVGGISRFHVEFFCLKLLKFSVGESSIVALISGTQKFWKGGGGGVSRCSVESFLSHIAENFRRGILYCCFNFAHRKSLEKRWAEYQDSTSNFFCLTVPKYFVVEPFSISIISGIEKVSIRGGVSRFSVEFFFVSHCRKFP